MSEAPLISIIVPVFNSGKTLQELQARIDASMIAHGITYELILVDDYSTDDSWQVICLLASSMRHLTGVRLDRNYGQWSATLAGASSAVGLFIATMDDDLEYLPEDIVTLYRYITTTSYRIVFGMAADKYKLQGKNQKLSHWRNKILNKLWRKPVTDSFRIFYRDIAFRGDTFMVDEHLEAFFKHHVPRRFWGYVSIGFHHRAMGSSQHTFLKKVKLFILFSYHYVRPIKNKTPLWTISEKIRSDHQYSIATDI